MGRFGQVSVLPKSTISNVFCCPNVGGKQARRALQGLGSKPSALDTKRLSLCPKPTALACRQIKRSFLPPQQPPLPHNRRSSHKGPPATSTGAISSCLLCVSLSDQQSPDFNSFPLPFTMCASTPQFQRLKGANHPTEGYPITADWTIWLPTKLL